MDKIENRDNIDYMKPENRFKATPMDLFKQGLRTQNWEAIATAYLMLTGEKIETHKHNDVDIFVPSEKEQQILLQPNTPEPIQVMPEPQPQPAPVLGVPADCVTTAMDPTKKLKRFTKATQHDCSPRQSTWKDDKVEAANEIIEDRKVPAEILEAQRPPVPMTKVRCKDCGRIDLLEPGQLPFGLRLTPEYRMRYLCNDCCVGARSSVDLDNDTSDEPLYEEGLVDGTTAG
jgi:hypothetical protein